MPRRLLLIHGWGESGGVFDRLVELLPHELSPVAIDLPGHGGTRAPDSGGYSPRELAQHCADLLRRLDNGSGERSIVLGTSSGGYVAQQLAVDHPDLVAARARDGAAIPARVWRESLEGLYRAVPPLETGSTGVPTLVLSGGRDDLLPDAHDRLVEAIPHARGVVYDDVGHLVLWECPDLVASDVADFAESLDRPPSSPV